MCFEPVAGLPRSNPQTNHQIPISLWKDEVAHVQQQQSVSAAPKGGRHSEPEQRAARCAGTRLRLAGVGAPNRIKGCFSSH